METLSRLQPGMRVMFEHQPHRVVRVNESWARIVPIAKRVVVIKPRFGKPVTFKREAPGHNISPNSELPIL